MPLQRCRAVLNNCNKCCSHPPIWTLAGDGPSANPGMGNYVVTSSQWDGCKATCLRLWVKDKDSRPYTPKLTGRHSLGARRTFTAIDSLYHIAFWLYQWEINPCLFAIKVDLWIYWQILHYVEVKRKGRKKTCQTKKNKQINTSKQTTTGAGTPTFSGKGLY